MPPIDSSIPLGVKNDSPLKSMSEWIGLGRAKQQFDRERETYDADVSKAQSEALSAQTAAARATRTLEDYTRQARAQTEQQESAATVAKAGVDPAIRTNQATASTAETGAERTRFELSAEQMQTLRNSATRYVNDPDFIEGRREKMIDKMADARDEAIKSGVPRWLAESMFAKSIQMADQNPKAVREQMIRQIAAGQSAAGQAGLAQPQGPMINDQQRFGQAQTNLFGPQPGGMVPGTTGQNQLPPTTPQFMPDGQGGGQMGYLGPQGGGAARPAAPAAPGVAPGAAPLRQGGFVQSGPPMGTEQNMQGTVAAVNDDWRATSSAANGAQNKVGMLMELRRYARDAATGVGGDKRSFAAGIASYLNIPEGALTRMSSEMVDKYAAQLAGAMGGNTDMARDVILAATPNGKMSQPGIEAAANSLIAQQQMALTKSRFLSRFKNSPDAYNNALSQWNEIADPRIYQYPLMDKASREKMVKGMNDEEFAVFRKLMQINQDLGFVRDPDAKK